MGVWWVRLWVDGDSLEARIATSLSIGPAVLYHLRVADPVSGADCKNHANHSRIGGVTVRPQCAIFLKLK